jgi:hypothetical protein
VNSVEPGSFLAHRHAEFARFYAPLAMLIAALSWAPIYAGIAARDGRATMTVSSDTLWSLSPTHAAAGGVLLIALVILLLVAAVRPVPTGVLVSIAVLAFLLGLSLAFRLGRPENLGLLTDTGRVTLAILFGTTATAAVHAAITRAYLSEHPAPRRSREPTV